MGNNDYNLYANRMEIRDLTYFKYDEKNLQKKSIGKQFIHLLYDAKDSMFLNKEK